MQPRHSHPALRRQRGNALVFSMLGLVIGGIVLALGINYYQTSQANAQVQSTVSEITAIIGGAQQNYGQYGYNGLTTAVAVGSRVIPETRADAGGKTATNSYSGAITLVDNSSTTPNTARLSYANVPASQCSQIINGAQILARQVSVGATDVKSLDGAVDIAKVTTQCTAAAAVSIDFVFGRT
jgi:type II secretory pathway pseudopilin PulG